MLYLRLGQALLQGDGKVLNDDNGFGAGVFELMFKLSWGVQRVDVDHHKTCSQDGGNGHWVLRHIGHHDGDAIAFFQTQ